MDDTRSIAESNQSLVAPSSEDFALGPKVNRKLYEPIILLKVLNESYRANCETKAADIPCNMYAELEELFHYLVSKLGQLCDSRRGGYTVTAFAILQKFEKVEYVFASNKRTRTELETTKAYITSILESLRDGSSEDGDEQRDIRAEILQDVLVFNYNRITAYLRNLKTALEQCIGLCEHESTNASIILKVKLQGLLELVKEANQPLLDDQVFFDSTRTVINAIANILTSPTNTVNIMIQRKIMDASANNTKPWREVRHHCGRLWSYQQAVDILIYARDLWPKLFDNFDVNYVPSSKYETNPLKANPLPVDTIVSRLPSTEDKERYARLAACLPGKDDINKAISDEWTAEKFKPYVHAEPLLLNYLENAEYSSDRDDTCSKYDGAEFEPLRYFNNWAYIGCSKPPCRLCEYYFTAHPGGVKIRKSHGNLYSNWRLPDGPDRGGLSCKEAKQQRLHIAKQIMVQLSDEIRRIVQEKVPGTRTHDSSSAAIYMARHGLNALSLRAPSLVTNHGSGTSVDGKGSIEDWVDASSGEYDSGGSGAAVDRRD
ncbi:hypothetical protein BX600DRAFT_497583 [Xylariales sp. PMI_506]|nr:hypothetical protein BX600DRAFT_497583 [Xylariales sp. PMI_506]